MNAGAQTKEQLRETLAAYQPSSADAGPGVVPAAVLVLLHDHDGDLHIVFQKRTDKVHDHKGQISFPGGASDPEDMSLAETALRETHEEIGVLPEDVDILGQLDEMVTVSNYVVTPFVGWVARYPYEWRFSDEEVAYLLEVPVSHLLEPGTLIPDRRFINGREYEFQSYKFGDDLIWGATARMLGNFLDVAASVPGFTGRDATSTGTAPQHAQ
ncbi:MAG TPA: CoA pyrophosphatase [Tepidiformaceae bacterium]|nr:CoA pyrophosphatase [Tepidiformaceae bacterium]